MFENLFVKDLKISLVLEGF